jgi:hypothetical protein
MKKNDALTEEAFKLVQKAAGPNSKIYEAVTDLEEYLEFSYDKPETVGKFIEQVKENEAIIDFRCLGGDVEDARDESTKPSIKDFWKGLCSRIDAVLED